MLSGYLVYIGSLIASFGTIGYALDAFKGKVQPNRVSFFLWTITPLIVFAAQVKEGVGVQSFMSLAMVLGCILILSASFFNKKARWELRKLDLACGAISIAGLVLWFLTGKGDIAIIFSIISDGFASLPTIIKAYGHPKTEVGWPWLLFASQGLLTLLTIDNWNFANYGYPFYIFAINFLIFLIVQSRIGLRLHKTI